MTISTAGGIITNPFTSASLGTHPASLEQYLNDTKEISIELKAIIKFQNGLLWGFTESPLFWFHVCEMNSMDHSKIAKTHGGSSVSSTELLGQDQIMLGEKVAIHRVTIRVPKNKTFKLFVSGWCMKGPQDECRAELTYDPTQQPLKLGFTSNSGFDRLYDSVEITT